jgi:glutamate racemase
MIRNKSIGIFDSGFGGLSVMRGIVKELPDYSFIYLGDSARVPYGTRSKETVYKFTKQAIDFLFKKGCELIIVACNTASSDALRLVQQKHVPKNYASKKVLGVLIPAAEDAISKTKNGRIGVIATQGTVKSRAFIRELRKINPKIKVYQKACPLLVPIVEAGEQNLEITDITLKKYIKPLIDNRIDTLILGCTHYGILEPKIREIVGKKMKIISESKIVAHKLKSYLENHPEVERELTKNRKRIFYSTDLTKNFEILGSKFFGEKIKPQKADL